ncbi:MAG: class I SAM-dependent methyltransferase, partial [Aridibacter sp.]
MSKPKSEKLFDDEKTVKEYIESRAEMDGGFLIEILRKYLEPNSTVLELGIGAGKDFEILSETFTATGSDNSQLFLDIYKQKNPDADLILLDAATLETDGKFDCIYSNKVLHHLSRNNLERSIKLQKKLLNNKGILFHTFWHGEKAEEFQDLKFIQYK